MPTRDEDRENRGNARRPHVPSAGEGAASSSSKNKQRANVKSLTEKTATEKGFLVKLKTSDGLTLSLEDAFGAKVSKAAASAKDDPHAAISNEYATTMADLLHNHQVYVVDEDGEEKQLSGANMDSHTGGKFLKYKWSLEKDSFKLYGKKWSPRAGEPHFRLYTDDKGLTIRKILWNGRHFSADAKKEFESQTSKVARAQSLATVSGAVVAETFVAVDRNEQSDDGINVSSVATSTEQNPSKARKLKTPKKPPASIAAPVQLKAPTEELIGKATPTGSIIPLKKVTIDLTGVDDDVDDDEQQQKESIKTEFTRSKLIKQQAGSTQASSSSQPATSSKQAVMIALMAHATESEEKLAASEEKLAASEANNQLLQQILGQKEDKIRRLQEALDKCQRETEALQDEILALTEAKMEADVEKQDLHDKNRTQQEEIKTLTEANEQFVEDHRGQQDFIQELQNENRTQHEEIQELLEKVKTIEIETRIAVSADLSDEMAKQRVERETIISRLRDENFDLTRQAQRLQQDLNASDEQWQQECERRENAYKLRFEELWKRRSKQLTGQLATQLAGQLANQFQDLEPSIADEHDDDDDEEEDEEDRRDTLPSKYPPDCFSPSP